MALTALSVLPRSKSVRMGIGLSVSLTPPSLATLAEAETCKSRVIR